MERETTTTVTGAFDVVMSNRLQNAVYDAFSDLKRSVLREAARLANQRGGDRQATARITRNDLLSALRTVMPAAEGCLEEMLSDEPPPYVRSAS